MKGDPLRFMLITGEPETGRAAELAGVDRVFVDMETRGKQERQGHLNTHRASHTLEDVERVAASVERAEVMVRVNPPGPGTPNEVEAAIEAGAQRLMLPMFVSVGEVDAFLEQVDGRVPVTFLVETPAALARLPLYLDRLGPRDHVHIGLNDLSLAAGLDFLFEPLAGGMLEEPARLCREAGVVFGFGGVGRIGNGDVPAEWILGEHLRLGSSWVILSRSFRGADGEGDRRPEPERLREELQRLRDCEAALRREGPDFFEQNRTRLRDRVFALAAA
ncbi:aldolase/citrate lyase family protein [Thioalkalivibrio sp. ALJ24]|uniref:aldolase/citrate lyase family protein n=1 Tax=Thioalkalivibrio sp. ALJ24 TaxID=545276 RepID=UPI0003620485|nr:aldolase/citrate lyase family protein [Thioalkalivibrio sp. ALJ24]